jgi:hypothetical protein
MKYTFPVVSLLCLSGWTLLATACSDEWDDHYDASELTSTTAVEVYRGSAWSYLQSQSDLSKITQALSSRQNLLQGDACTVIVCADGQWTDQTAASLSDSSFVANSVSDVAVAPTSLTDGRGIYMLSGKNLWVSVAADGALALNEVPVTRTVKTDNGYVYYVSNPIAVQPSVYKYIQSLGEDYSLFKEYIALFEEQYFDAAASTPSGVDAMGNTVYSDSVIETRNTLMDRFNADGIATWNMRSESFQSTVFIPNNNLLKHAYESALDSIPYWMNRAATAADSLKFKKWIVASCFVDRRLTPEEVAPTAEGQFECVGGYIQEIDETLDKETYTEYDAAQWKPSVQQVNTDGVDLSNGVAYYLTDYKIPNHIVIWRVKSKFYQVWSALTSAQQGWDATNKSPLDGGYFRWNHWSEPLVVNDAQGSFELSSTLPTMYYHVLTAIPDAEALADSLPCSVEYDGLMYNSDDKKFGLSEVHLPAGEYYLRMGFKHSLKYSISIYFADGDEEITEANRLVEDMSLIATGSNFHFDRGGAMEGLDFYGSESVGYPEYFDWRFWYEQDPVTYQKASAYDTDGYQVAIVTLKKPGNFKIKIESNDDAELYSTGTGDRSKNNVLQLMMYHWCLRPTTNNY